MCDISLKSSEVADLALEDGGRGRGRGGAENPKSTRSLQWRLYFIWEIKTFGASEASPNFSFDSGDLKQAQFFRNAGPEKKFFKLKLWEGLCPPRESWGGQLPLLPPGSATA